MTPFTVLLTTTAQEDIQGLTPANQSRILNRLEWIGENAALLLHQPLKGEQWIGCFRYRIGDYRVIYRLDQQTAELTVVKVGHRRDVYR